MISFLLALVIASPRAVERVEPKLLVAGQTQRLTIHGSGFQKDDRAYLGGRPLETQWLSDEELAATVRPDTPGFHALTVGQPGALSFPIIVEIRPPPLRFDPLRSRTISEDELLELVLRPEGDLGARVFAVRLPPGAHWSEAERTLRFRPDFTQGGHKYQVEVVARSKTATATATLEIEVKDTIRPIEPVVRELKHHERWSRYVLEQRTDATTSAPPWLGRSYEARVCIAKAPGPLPVRIFLHGAQAEMPDGCVADEHRIYPSDPDTTYWWGYGYPGAPKNYTQLRILHLMEWVLDNHPNADPERVYVMGTSMGGAGAISLASAYPHHFASVDSYWVQSIPRFQRPGRAKTLAEIWGPPPALDPKGGNPWDLQDFTRELTVDQYYFVRHGKDDPVIHFGAAVRASPLTQRTFYQALEAQRAGHYVVWDEAGHGQPDPVLGTRWWDASWDRMHDPTSFLRRNRAFPAFSSSSANDNPGDGQPKSPRSLDPTRGYAGRVKVAGDTGWKGALAGMLNRWLRWDASKIVDTLDRFEMPLFLSTEPGLPSSVGYPGRRDVRQPIVVSVTPRRVQEFRLLPGERVRWTFGDKRGEVVADADGAVTIEAIAVKVEPQTLILERE